MYDCVIIAIDTDAGYQALHEYVQAGWEAHFFWEDAPVKLQESVDD